jgi:hypothetical protein
MVLKWKDGGGGGGKHASRMTGKKFVRNIGLKY